MINSDHKLEIATTVENDFTLLNYKVMRFRGYKSFR